MFPVRSPERIAAERPEARNNQRLTEVGAIERFIAEHGVTCCPPAYGTHSQQAKLMQSGLPEPVFNWKTKKYRREPA
jgi:hypothetical protein